jgi:hypothetical protein
VRVEPLLQLGVGTPKICYFVIERRGHMLTPSAPPLPKGYVNWHPLPVEKGVRLDHLLIEGVKAVRCQSSYGPDG